MPPRKAAEQAVVRLPWRERIPSVRTLNKFMTEAQAAVRLRGVVSVLLTTDKAIRRLNRQFRGKNKATDVLSFPVLDNGFGPAAERVAGDLAISIDTARRQATEQEHALSCELKVLLLHGLLHLAGLDHEADSGQMARREQKLRAQLKLPLGLIERVTADTGSGTSRARSVAGPAKKTAAQTSAVAKTKTVAKNKPVIRKTVRAARAGQ